MPPFKISFSELAARITGVSIPIFGISWKPSEPERKIVRDVFIMLEDRRALYNDFAHEIEHEVAESVLQIRSELTAALQRLPDNSKAAPCLRAMRAACREYLDTSRPGRSAWGGTFTFMSQLGRLRAIVGVQAA